jgi:hypothetical protein
MELSVQMGTANDEAMKGFSMTARICPHKSRHSLRKVRISCVWYHAAVVHSDHSNWSKGDGEGKMVARLVISKQTRFRKRFELKEHRRISSVVILRQMKSKSVAKCNEYLSRSLVYSQTALQALFTLHANWRAIVERKDCLSVESRTLY